MAYRRGYKQAQPYRKTARRQPKTMAGTAMRRGRSAYRVNPMSTKRKASKMATRAKTTYTKRKRKVMSYYPKKKRISK